MLLTLIQNTRHEEKVHGCHFVSIVNSWICDRKIGHTETLTKEFRPPSAMRFMHRNQAASTRTLLWCRKQLWKVIPVMALALELISFLSAHIGYTVCWHIQQTVEIYLHLSPAPLSLNQRTQMVNWLVELEDQEQETKDSTGCSCKLILGTYVSPS